MFRRKHLLPPTRSGHHRPIPLSRVTNNAFHKIQPSQFLAQSRIRPRGQILCDFTYKVPRVVKFLGTENRMRVARGWGRRNEELRCNGHESFTGRS